MQKNNIHNATSVFKLAIVDDHKMFPEGLRFLLSEFNHIQIVSESQNGQEFINSLESTQPDIVLMDINMPEMNGIQATEVALKIQPSLNIIALTMFGEEDYYYKMIHAGAKGFLLKESGSTELEEAINTIVRGENYFSMSLLKNIIISLGEKRKKEEPKQFTKRETEVLQLICSGLSAKEIANELSISPRTVEVHKSNLFEKTQCQNTSSLIMLAIKNEWINL